jgi:hypothetical protein
MNVNINTAVYEELLERGFTHEFAVLALQYAESYFASDSVDRSDITGTPTTAEDVIPSSSRVVA